MNSTDLIIGRAERLFQSFGEEKEHLGSTFDEKIQQVLAKIEKCRTYTTKTPEEIAERVVHLLHYFDQSLEYLKIHPLAIQRIHQRLIRSEKSILSELKEKEQPVSAAKVDCRLAFFCDIDAPDYNGAIATFAWDALQSQIPFVTTSSLFTGAKVTRGTLAPVNLEGYVKNHEREWRIFKNGNFIIFIPEKLTRGLSNPEALSLFDFHPPDLFRCISASEAGEMSETPPSLDEFFSLFSPESSRSKLIWMAGHGGIGRPAGLTALHYTQFLQFMKRQCCVGLTVSSCFAGGASSLLHLPQHAEDEQTVNFPVIIRSIGDFPTLTGMSAEKDVAFFLDHLETLIESSGSITIPKMKRMLLAAEQGRMKRDTNLVQIYLPPSGPSPGGFRSIGESAASDSLTFGRLRREQLEAEKSKRSEIVVKNKKLLEIHPLVVDIPLSFEGNPPLLLSMIPGRAHHFLKEIYLDTPRLIHYFRRMFHEYQSRKLGVAKAFVVDTIKEGKLEKRQCIFFLQPEGNSLLLFRHGNAFFMTDPSGRAYGITSFHYLTSLHHFLSFTQPSDQSIRSQTGGQQSEVDFIRLISSEEFWGPKYGDYLSLKPLFDPPFVAKLTGQTFLRFIETNLQSFVPDDYAQLAFLLLQYRRIDLVRLLLTRGHITANVKDWSGNPLLVAAVSLKEHEFVRYLLEHGGNVNTAQASTGMTPLHAAVQTGDRQMTALLLTHPDVLVDSLDQEGLTAMAYGWRNPQLFQLFKEKRASLNIPDKEGKTILSHLCSRTLDRQLMKKLLEAGADPNVGYPSPLFWAISRGDVEAVQLLLSYGANPFNRGPRESDFIEAIKIGNLAVLELFLEHPLLKVNIRDFEQNAPLNAAIHSCSLDFVRRLMEKGARLQYSTPLGVTAIKNAIERRPEEERERLIELLWQYKDPQDNHFKDMIINLYFRLHAEDNFPEGTLPQPQELLIKNCVELACENWEKYRLLLRHLKAWGIDLNAPVGISVFDEKPPLAIAIAKKTVNTIGWLIGNGANVTPFFKALIELGNPLLVAAAITRGARVAPTKAYNPLYDIVAHDPTGELTQLAVQYGADLHFVGQHPSSPFAAIVASGNSELIQWCSNHEAVKKK